MNAFVSIILALALCIGGVLAYNYYTVNIVEAPKKNVVGIFDLIEITAPQKGTLITSPVKITGQARGIWYFEALFPVEIYDRYGKILGNGYAQAQSNWETDNFVQFVGYITFAQPEFPRSVGYIRFKSNNSGSAMGGKYVDLPVKF